MNPDAGKVRVHVAALARPKPRVEIGRHYTGRREYYWDSRTGVYNESLPLLNYDEWLIQQALVGPARLVRRARDQIRQPLTTKETP
jgi:hypothetical protein